MNYESINFHVHTIVIYSMLPKRLNHCMSTFFTSMTEEKISLWHGLLINKLEVYLL